MISLMGNIQNRQVQRQSTLGEHLPLPNLPLPRLGQWPRRLDTPSPRQPRAFFARQSGDCSGAGPGLLGRTPSQGRPGRQGRDASPVALALGLWTLLWGSAQGGVGRKQVSPAQPSLGRADGAGVGRSSCPKRPAGRHTWPVTHSQDTQSWITHVEMQMCMCVHTHT